MQTPIEILLIEDSASDIRLMQEAFKEIDFQVKLNVVRDGVSAMNYLFKRDEFADAVTPSLILLDLNIPKKNGRQILYDIKHDPELRQIPVIVLTISQAEEGIKQCYNLHANSYIIKPFDVDHLIQLVKSIVFYWMKIVTLSPKKESRHG